MADKDKGLYLPLKIDLNEWEKSLATADADLQKAMREMRSSVSDLRLRYDVEIAGAKSAGDDTRALRLENEKLNRIYETQRQVVEALNRAYRQSVAEKGASAKESESLARQLVAESKQLERVQAQLSGLNFGKSLGKSISDGLASASPAFANIRRAVSGITGELSGMGGAATTAAKAIGGIGLAAATVGAVYTGLEKVTEHVNEIARAGVAASDPVFQLRESLQSTYEDAEYLFRVTAVDGSNAESLANTLVKLDATLKKDADGTNIATQTLQRYGAELRNADGSLKSYKDQLQELSRAAQTAAKAGEYADFKAGLPGALRTTEFDHLLLGLENYETKAVSAAGGTKIFYDELHELSDWMNVVNEARRQNDAIKGGFFAGAGVQNLKNEADTLKAVGLLLDENSEKYSNMAKQMGDVTDSWTNFKGVATLVLEDLKADLAGIDFKGLADFIGGTIGIPGAMDAFLGATGLGEKINSAQARLDAKRAEVRAQREAAEAENAERMKNQRLNKIRDVENKAQEKKAQESLERQLEKQLAAQEQFARELRDLRSTDYERELNQLNDKVTAWREAGIEEVAIAERVALEKQAIDEKYFKKLQAEQEKTAKQAEAEYAKQAEAAKKAREASISEAESTLRNNLKLIRYIKREQEAGTYSDERAREYANKLYMRQNGFRTSDISALQAFGVDRLKDIADARDRLFAGFAPPESGSLNNSVNNNNVVINNSFDGTVVEDMAAMDRLANKVAEIIAPAIQQALNGGAQYGY